MKTRIFLILCAFALSLPLPAQKRKTKQQKAKVEEKAPNPGLELYKSMISSTAKLLFVDSLVVDKNDFIRHIPLNRESGRIAMRNSVFSFYENELADRRYIADGDTAASAIYAQDFIGADWTAPKMVIGSSGNFQRTNYPFLMADGITLYFGAEGEESMGGYDLFMTTFDCDNGTFYTPENMGLPYNSTANDYMLAIDDINKLGWLVTDRRQPADKVCIYTFVPSESRQGFDDTDLNNEEIEKYSMIMSIADTWKFGNRKAARARLNELKNELKSKRNEDNDNERFVITDNIVYRSANDFKSEQAKEMYMRLKIQRKELYDNMERLSSMRRLYHESGTTMRSTLKTDLLSLEKTVEDMYAEIHKQEKAIRKTEYNLLNNH